MKNLNRSYSVIAFVLLASCELNTSTGSSVNPTEGGIAGNGADLINPLENDRWFFETQRNVSACIQQSPSFPIPPTQSKTMLVDAWDTWIHFTQKLYTEEIGRSGRVPDLAPYNKLILNNACIGNEDLVVYFGISNSQIDNDLKALISPQSIAKLKTRDPMTSWGQGYLWFSSREIINYNGTKTDFSLTDYSNFRLKTLMMHELGHVFGVAHTAGTIMSENIIYELAACNDSQCASFKPSIEQGLFITNTPRSFDSASEVQKNMWEINLDVLKQIFGDSSLATDATLSFKFDATGKTLLLNVQSPGISHAADVRMNQQILSLAHHAWNQSMSTIFSNPFTFWTLNLVSSSWDFTGDLTANGVTYPVLVRLNGENSIEFLDGSKRLIMLPGLYPSVEQMEKKGYAACPRPSGNCP